MKNVTKIDRGPIRRVSSLMPEIRSWLPATILSLAVACGGGTKKAGTTPTAGGGSGTTSGQSMTDDGGATGGTGGPMGGGPAGGGPAGGGDVTGGGTDAGFTPPNYDPDPATVKTQVDQQIAAAKAALSQPTPDADGALRAAKAALALDASNVEAAAYIAFAYYHKHLYDTAELVLDDLMADKGVRGDRARKSATVSYVYGLIYDKTKRPQRAEFAFKHAVELDPNHVSALIDLGVYQLKNSQYSAAQTTFERVTKQFHRNDAITLTVARLGVPRAGGGLPELGAGTQPVRAQCRGHVQACAGGQLELRTGLLQPRPALPRHRALSRRVGQPRTTPDGEELLRQVQEHAGSRHEAVRGPGKRSQQADQACQAEAEEPLAARRVILLIATESPCAPR